MNISKKLTGAVTRVGLGSRLVPAAFLAACMLVLAGARSAARAAQVQVATGQVVDSVSGRPLAGAIVSVLDARGADTIGVTLSREDGRFSVTRSTSAGILVVRSVGHRPVRITLAAGASAGPIRVSMRLIEQALPSVVVREITACPRSQVGVSRVLTVWTAVSTALENSRISRDVYLQPFDFTVYERQLDPLDGRYLDESMDTLRALTTRPFRAATPAVVRDSGYAVYEFATETRERPGSRRTAEYISDLGTLIFLAPDELVLLDPLFQNTHCFWITASDERIGLHFVPAVGMRRTDIAGTFWLDARTLILQEITFRYTRFLSRLDPALRRNLGADTLLLPTRYDTAGASFPPLDRVRSMWEPGGSVSYERQRNGSFIVTSWSIWSADSWSRSGFREELLPRPQKVYESGGEVIRRQQVPH